jgi:hypothetical protein
LIRERRAAVLVGLVGRKKKAQWRRWADGTGERELLGVEFHKLRFVYVSPPSVDSLRLDDVRRTDWLSFLVTMANAIFLGLVDPESEPFYSTSSNGKEIFHSFSHKKAKRETETQTI